MLLFAYKCSNWLYRHHVPLIPFFIYYLMRTIKGSSIPPTVIIGKGTKFAYGGIGLVIHARSIIGCNCMIGQGITIGGKSGWYEVPVIGNNVEINAGVRILGPVKIGNNVIIGANAVVVKDVPDNCIVAGVPAKIIRADMTPNDFMEMKKVKERGSGFFQTTPMA